MMKLTLIAILVLVSFQGAQAVLGVDISQSFNDFQCLKGKNIQFVIARAYKSYGAVDSNAVQTLKNAKAAGLKTDIYHFPCLGKVSATEQANAVISTFGTLYGTVWIDVESNPSSNCGWSSNTTTNCTFLKDIVAAYQSKGKSVGIYGSKYQWQSIFGSSSSCANFTKLPVWYAHYDKSPSFSDWSTLSFGGWSKPTIKQYVGDTTLCGVGVDLDFY